jgi:hypothetical protein
LTREAEIGQEHRAQKTAHIPDVISLGTVSVCFALIQSTTRRESAHQQARSMRESIER